MKQQLAILVAQIAVENNMEVPQKKKKATI
jgi:hypothetical protein